MNIPQKNQPAVKFDYMKAALEKYSAKKQNAKWDLNFNHLIESLIINFLKLSRCVYFILKNNSLKRYLKFI